MQCRNDCNAEIIAMQKKLQYKNNCKGPRSFIFSVFTCRAARPSVRCKNQCHAKTNAMQKKLFFGRWHAYSCNLPKLSARTAATSPAKPKQEFKLEPKVKPKRKPKLSLKSSCAETWRPAVLCLAKNLIGQNPAPYRSARGERLLQWCGVHDFSLPTRLMLIALSVLGRTETDTR